MEGFANQFLQSATERFDKNTQDLVNGPIQMTAPDTQSTQRSGSGRRELTPTTEKKRRIEGDHELTKFSGFNHVQRTWLAGSLAKSNEFVFKTVHERFCNIENQIDVQANTLKDMTAYRQQNDVWNNEISEGFDSCEM